MTTIVWDGKTLAADGRETSDGVVTSDNAVKVITIDPELHHIDGVGISAFACSGMAGGTRILKALMAHEDGLHALTIIPNDVTLTALVITVSGKGLWLYSGDEDSVVLIEPVIKDAIGSGSHYARAAMALGKNAEEAVAFAAQFDVNTGGEIQWFCPSGNK